MAQKEQKELVRHFFAGEFNVLVATCIAEEGLDIGEVDLIVNYDSQKSPIRMIQRMGRYASRDFHATAAVTDCLRFRQNRKETYWTSRDTAVTRRGEEV